jgi:hypothetical protein
MTAGLLAIFAAGVAACGFAAAAAQTREVHPKTFDSPDAAAKL